MLLAHHAAGFSCGVVFFQLLENQSEFWMLDQSGDKLFMSDEFLA
jgi:hypothetical protein